MQKRLICPHRILKFTILHQAFFDKRFQCYQRIGAGHRPVKMFKCAGMAAEIFFNIRYGRFCYGVNGEDRWHWYILRAFFIKCAAIFGIVIPASADWIITVHHDLMALAHHPVKILHAHLFVAAGPFGEFKTRNKKMLILAHRNGQL